MIRHLIKRLLGVSRTEDKWDGLDGPSYTLTNLGRPAVFLIPSHKLRTPMGEDTVEHYLHDYLMEHYGAFTTTTVPYFGFWRNGRGKVDYDECRRYEVSFVGKERIPELLEVLAKICEVIGEDCFYIKAGQYTSLMYPRKPS
ncbi:hypothetical protein CO174_03135 [Candidatus Uhrbacteria bacterium CG_4_9_14_3_um_filter_50_9]|uniref:Uncharacterized protein n=1 Tax=Candidatus Uhrbacteria bacterium CG_4_9_14_3_um_filter_50_9 TaxID=1975035 RepID=A0A2M7XC89_9BACT|nr:MAG: hypothetical protein CO174_03135 [Candidatus Uhrbacteria bacterium CG_4_9_14_3_um_filter_50_9]